VTIGVKNVPPILGIVLHAQLLLTDLTLTIVNLPSLLISSVMDVVDLMDGLLLISDIKLKPLVDNYVKLMPIVLLSILLDQITIKNMIVIFSMVLLLI
jgi:hypothetical protein